MIEDRPIKEIIDDAMSARVNKAKLAWSPEEIASDMLVVTKQLQIDLEKYLEKMMEAPNRRARLLSKVLETLGKNFRVQSVKANKNGKN
jgi:hypothetical protein